MKSIQIDNKILSELIDSKNLRYCSYNFFHDIDDVLTEERLNEIQTSGDLPLARSLDGNDNRYHIFRIHQKKLEGMVSAELDIKVEGSGFYWYPYRGYCGWHTNSNKVGKRIYVVWSQEDKKSFFRYQDPDTKKIVTSWDKQGWQIKQFEVSDQKPLWHCVGSYTNRISLGFKVCEP